MPEIILRVGLNADPEFTTPPRDASTNSAVPLVIGSTSLGIRSGGWLPSASITTITFPLETRNPSITADANPLGPVRRITCQMGLVALLASTHSGVPSVEPSSITIASAE